MPFNTMPQTPNQEGELTDFLREEVFTQLYRGYSVNRMMERWESRTPG